MATITCTVNDLVTCAIGKEQTIEVDTTKFSASVNAYIWNYGLKQMLADANSAEKEAEAKLAKSQKKLDSLYAGEVAQARQSGGSVEREVRAIAMAYVKPKLKAAGKVWSKMEDADKEKVLAHVIAKNPDWRAQAETIVASRKEAVAETETVDLADLGL
jgi:hypothetical protein